MLRNIKMSTKARKVRFFGPAPKNSLFTDLSFALVVKSKENNQVRDFYTGFIHFKGANVSANLTIRRFLPPVVSERSSVKR